MKTIFSTLVVSLLLCGYTAKTLNAQSHVLTPDSKLWVDGTSNKNDWTVTATEFQANAVLGDDGTVTSLTLEVQSSKMVSEKSSIMDRLMHKALKVNEHPVIVFELASLTPGEDGDTAVAAGNLTIAGVTNEVAVEIGRIAGDNGNSRYNGSHSLKMTDYGMKPPSAMFGALHTGDEVTVRFEVGLIAAEAGS